MCYNVFIYDSLLPHEITVTLKKQVCTFFKVATKQLTFNVVDVIVATDIVHGRNPVKSMWSTQDMRPHLMCCLEKADITPFPIREERKIRFGRSVKNFSSVDVHCTCRMPFDQGEDGGDMILCNLCAIWHIR